MPETGQLGRCTRAVVSKPRIVRKRVFKKFRTSHFLEDVAQVDWESLLAIEDVNVCQELFDKTLKEILDFHCPVKRIQIRRNYTPWLTDELKTKQAELQLAKPFSSRS